MEDVRERLEKELAAATTTLRELGIRPREDEPAPRPDSPSVNDIGDVAQASERRDLEFGTRERLAARITRLTAALQRLDEGHYGVCERCERQIPPARLRAIPEASLCRDCQEDAERSEGTPRPASL